MSAITDSGSRDFEGMKAIGFPVFGEASVPYGPGNIIRPVAANEPVICGWVEVQSDDLVATDCDGVFVIPKAVIGEVKERVTEQSIHEKEIRRTIDAVESLEKAYSL